MKSNLWKTILLGAIGLFGVLGVAKAADEVAIAEFQPVTTGGIRANNAIPVKLSATKPANVGKEPTYRNSPQYGTIAVGDAKGGAVLVVVDSAVGSRVPRIYVDANGNGDLTDDPALNLTAGPGKDELVTNGTINAKYALGAGTRIVPSGLAFTLKGVALTYNRDYGRKGKITLNGKSFNAFLTDENLDGCYHNLKHAADKPANVLLLIDRNEDGKYDPKLETFDTGKPFRVSGRTYEILQIDNRGTKLVLRASTQQVKANDLKQGGKVIAFDANTFEKKLVNFPDDYIGKIVLLQFWATWSQPSVDLMPNLVATYKKYHKQGFEILGVCLDEANQANSINQFMQQYGMTWPQIYDGKYLKSEIGTLYGVETLPYSILVDGTSGRIAVMGDALNGPALGLILEKAMEFLKKKP